MVNIVSLSKAEAKKKHVSELSEILGCSHSQTFLNAIRVENFCSSFLQFQTLKTSLAL